VSRKGSQITFFADLVVSSASRACKVSSGAFFVTAGASWYFSWYHISVPVPFFGRTITPEFLGIRGFIHFALFLISFYFGFIKK
jgi:hypothetical protein